MQILNRLIVRKSNTVRATLATIGFLCGAIATTVLTVPVGALQVLAEKLPGGYLMPVGGATQTILLSCILIMICTGLATLMIPDTQSINDSITELSGRVPHDERHLKELEKEISQTLDRILGTLKNHSEFTHAFADSLEVAGKNLIEITSPEQLRVAIGFLISENNKMHQETLNLQSDLTTSKLQVENLRRNLELAEESGMRDSLTSLWNRRAFDDLLDNQILQSELRRTPISLILSDIDHFKNINDTYGHLSGDDVLRLVASTIAANVKGKDTVSRFGGEEFAIILPDTSLENALIVALQIKESLATQQWLLPKQNTTIKKVTASFGVAELQQGELKIRLIERADQKLYLAKKSGRNCVMG